MGSEMCIRDRHICSNMGRADHSRAAFRLRFSLCSAPFRDRLSRRGVVRAASRCPPPPSPGLGLWWWGVSTPTPTPLPCLSLPLSCLPICHGWRTRLGCHFRETAKTHAENQLSDLLSRRTSHRLPCLDVCLRWCLLFSVLLACVWLLVTRKAYADSTMDGETDISVMSASDLTSIGFDSTVDTDLSLIHI